MTLPLFAPRRRPRLLLAGLALVTIGCQAVFGGFEVDENGSPDDPPTAVLGTGGQSTGSTGGTSGQASLPGACDVPGVRRCSDAALELCVGGQWQSQDICRTAGHCDPSLAHCLVCVEGESRCVGEKEEQLCDTTIGQWAPQRDCGVGRRCDEELGQCVKCDPLEGVCVAQSVLCQCAEDRQHFEPISCTTVCLDMGTFDRCEDGEGMREGSLEVCERI